MSDPHKIEKAIAQYNAANSRRFQNYSFFWQASALGLAAPAFLFAVALGSSTSDFGRIVASALSIGVSLASLTLMHTQSGYQKIEGRWMDFIEAEHDFPMHMAHQQGRTERGQAIRNAEVHLFNSRPELLNEVTFAGKCKCEGGNAHPLPVDDREPGRFSKAIGWFDDATHVWQILWWAFLAAGVLVILLTLTSRHVLAG